MSGKLTPQTGSARARVLVLTLVAIAVAVAAFGAIGYASPVGSAAQQQYAPQSTAPPTISGTPTVGQTLTASNGTFSGDQPITFTYQWQRCDTNGGACVAIAGATAQTYTLQTADLGHTIRVVVTARNASGTASGTSVPTTVVAAAGPAGQIRLPNGGISIPAASVDLPERLIIDQVRFQPNPVRSRKTTIRVTVRVRDTRGYFIRGAQVFVRSTPLVTTTPPEQVTLTNGSVTMTTRPRADFPLRNGYFVQFFVRARKAGDNVLAGVSTRRLVQLRTATGYRPGAKGGAGGGRPPASHARDELLERQAVRPLAPLFGRAALRRMRAQRVPEAEHEAVRAAEDGRGGVGV